jgi:hypothetical protein
MFKPKTTCTIRLDFLDKLHTIIAVHKMAKSKVAQNTKIYVYHLQREG